MQNKKTTEYFIVLTIVFMVGFGCKFIDSNKIGEKPEEPKTTYITKEILQERLGAKDIEIAPDISKGKPNPLTLNLKFSNQNNNFLLNREYFDNFSALANQLREIFRQRENNGIFIEGTNEIYKKITLPAYESYIEEYNSQGIFVEDFEKLVDDLRNEGFDQLELDVYEQNLPPFTTNNENKTIEELLKDSSRKTKNDSLSGKPDPPKTISGGFINGKAADLPKPIYPAAARAVKASGAVNVQVLVDEKGNVVSANAVSGHPLLHQSAVAAARQAKFKPTLLSGKPVKVKGVIVYNFTP